ncbi:hypothetical protein ACJMK2_013381 [Sinanodonta woodiana]|uniref:BTB domain-containing protein n=1 Tax=Sinanodonta woodiana TaxID=1069815 RepID=A0ABD3UXB7_SINWO
MCCLHAAATSINNAGEPRVDNNFTVKLSLKGFLECKTKSKMTNFWEAGNTVLGCLEQLCMLDHFADVHFVFPKCQGQGLLPAHRLILAMRSPVFEAMFYGGLSESSHEIRIEDIPMEIFSLLLRYIYTDVADLQDDNVLHVLYAAEKYSLNDLIEKCSHYLELSLCPENACSLFNQTQLYFLEDLGCKCLEYIADNMETVMNSDDFLNLTSDSLDIILPRDDLIFQREVDLFRSVMSWAKNQCEENDVEATPENIRIVLGKKLHLIRFPLLTKTEITEFVAPTRILNQCEMFHIETFLTWPEGDSDVNGFPCRLRVPPELKFALDGDVINFQQMNPGRGYFLRNGVSTLIIRVTHKVTLTKFKIMIIHNVFDISVNDEPVEYSYEDGTISLSKNALLYPNQDNSLEVLAKGTVIAFDGSIPSLTLSNYQTNAKNVTMQITSAASFISEIYCRKS